MGKEARRTEKNDRDGAENRMIKWGRFRQKEEECGLHPHLLGSGDE